MTIMTAEKHFVSLFRSDEQRWQAVLARDKNADGQFIYAVKTTGIYCRPSCPSRRGKRENVVFYDTATAAAEAGFRPCQRCHPDGEQTLAAQNNDRHAQMVASACRYIEQAEDIPQLDEIAKMMGSSPAHLHRLFKAFTGLTPKAYGQAYRANKIRHSLADDKAKVTDAIYDAGFGSSSRFYENSNARLGMTPTVFRDGGQNTLIHFAIGQCLLGSILVATSAKGICAIFLGDNPDALARDLQDRFPKATLIGGDAEFEQLVAKVVGFVEAPRIGLDLPLDMQGTAFQERVWQALRAIPVGATVSYRDIAQVIGAPKSMRAVAQACGANKIAVAIPCHRVVRTDGDLSGYRWGVERKRALLQSEQEQG